MNSTASPKSVLWPAALLAAVALGVVIAGAFIINRQLRDHERQRASHEARQLAFGISRQVSDQLWRVHEDFVFSLTNLPYERLLDHGEVSSATLVPLRRFLSLNPNLLRTLIVTGPDGQSRSLTLTGKNEFHLSPLAETGLPTATPEKIIIGGVIQEGTGSIRAYVSAVVDPRLFWTEALTTFSLSHPGFWAGLLDTDGRVVATRNNGRAAAAPVFTPSDTLALQNDASEGFEGRGFYEVMLDGESHHFISAYAPASLETWRGLVMISIDEQTVLGPAGDALNLLAIMAGVLVLVFLAVFYLFTRHSLRNQIQLEDSRRRIATVLNTVQSGILLIHSHTGRITEVNASAIALLGISADEVLGQPIDTILPPASTAAFFRAGAGAGFEVKISLRSGSVRHVLATSGELNVSGSHYRLCSFVDITPLKETESRLQETLRRAEQSARDAEAANTAKSAFLAMMSHELRTPLNSILGLSESLIERLHGPLSDKQDRYLHLVLTSGRHLLSLINDILDLAKIESGREDLQLVPCQIGAFCNSALEVIQPMVTKRGQSISVELPSSPLYVSADGRRLQQILVNLLGNAVKFTPVGGRLGLRVEATSSHVTLCVWDEGIGIGSTDLARIFKPFVQLDARLAREYGGTGLGLALVKQLVALHHGNIDVTSTAGEGSCFTVTLPLCAPPAPPLSNPPFADPEESSLVVPDPAAGKILVLLAEDTEFNIIPIRDYLQIMGCRVEIAENGAVAVQKTVSLRPDIVLMDVQMPVMDGIEAIKNIRSLPDAVLAAIPIIAVTALAMPSDRELCLNAGATDYIAKPISLRMLYTRIMEILTDERSSP
ncbi:hybrid sensor histidine kinase/response regulator [Rariglobus hedericola]|uniref:histidine kinase n=1 Tax=Rariglobus hedericola TaxID=2597822 RepID=A0A556QPP0_9BACT|nr:ATP-binding protein [Rariglobus hedericola]TSJ78599.1 response regulator [Rariglobus hedericola]